MGRLGYDAENRLKTFDNAVASVQEQETYFYDGLGQRVKRQANIRGRFFVTQDHLGSTRLVTKQDKTFAECRDFFPFGGRIASGLKGRSLGCYGVRYYSARLGRFVSPDEPFAARLV